MAMAKRFEHNKGNTAICYYRYSSDAQRDVSIEQQRNAAHEYCDKHGYRIIKEYEDRAISGTREDRPGFQEMLFEIERLRPAYAVFWKTDRLSRDRYDSAIAKKRFRDCGVSVEYVAESMPEDEAERVLMEGILEAFAQHYVVAHSKNVVRGLNANASKCWFNGHRILGYKGKPNSRYEIDPDTAPIVQKVFQSYIDGVPLTQICDDLNNAGFKTAKGGKFTVNSARYILTNDTYLGIYKWGDTVIEGGMPRLISDEDFEAARRRLDANKRGGRPPRVLPEDVDYWLTPYLRCGLCGDTLHGISGTSKSGDIYYYYACNSHKRGRDCKLKYQKKDIIEKIVLYFLEQLISNNETRTTIAKRCFDYYVSQNAGSDVYEQSIRAKLKETETTLGNIMKAIEAGIFNETTKKRMDELELQKAMLEDELRAELERRQYQLTLEDVIAHLESYAGNLNDHDTRDLIISTFIDKVYIYDDHVVATFRFIDDPREISFEEAREHFAIDSILLTPPGEAYDPKAVKVLDELTKDNDCNIINKKENRGKRVKDGPPPGRRKRKEDDPYFFQ